MLRVNPFMKGMRVQYSPLGKDTFSRRHGAPGPFKFGTVAARPVQPHYVAVRWDGAKCPQYYAVVFIEMADEPSSQHEPS